MCAPDAGRAEAIFGQALPPAQVAQPLGGTFKRSNMANDNHLQMVKEYYEKIGVEEMSIVEVIHMVGFAEWLESCLTKRAVDVLEQCANFKKARDGKCYNCGCEESAHH